MKEFCKTVNMTKGKNQTVNDGAHSKNPIKCTYHVTFDLDLDLSLSHSRSGGRVTAPIVSRKLIMRRGSVESM